MQSSSTRIPFPTTDTPTRCADDPALFAIEDIPDEKERAKALAQAKRACAGCPIAADCLKWALANRNLTQTGVWAATTVQQRGVLRKKLIRRHGPDWVAVIADADRLRKEREQAARVQPVSVREKALARLEEERLTAPPAPYEPWREPMTPARQAQNRRLLLAGLTTKAAA